LPWSRICLDHPSGWTDAARYAALIYNQSYHTTTGTSPYFIRHGAHPRTATDVVTGTDPPREADWHLLVQEHRAAIDLFVVDSIVALGASYDRRNASIRGAHTFSIGDKVYLHQVYPESFDRAGVDVKLFPAFRPELFVVTEVVSPQLCRIQEDGMPTGFNDVVHVQRLKPFAPRTDALSFNDFYDPRETPCPTMFTTTHPCLSTSIHLATTLTQTDNHTTNKQTNTLPSRPILKKTHRFLVLSLELHQLAFT
jgi:hypothetical protein